MSRELSKFKTICEFQHNLSEEWFWNSIYANFVQGVCFLHGQRLSVQEAREQLNLIKKN